MKPIYIVLYAVIVTLLLTLAFPRLRQVSPTLQRFTWLGAAIGGIALLIVTYFALIS